MNVDTDTQYAFTRPVAGHMFANYDGVLKVDGEVGNKKAYDPRAWGKAAEAGHGRPGRRGLREPLAAPAPASSGYGAAWRREFQDLMAGPPPTLLPEDPAAAGLAAGTAAAEVVRAHPSRRSPGPRWPSRRSPTPSTDDVTAYAYARVGYHRSLDQLRRNGWKGHGPVPWEHEPNQRLPAGARRAGPGRRRGSARPPRRSAARTFLRDSSPTAYAALLS